MYRITVKNKDSTAEYTVPNESIRLLAYSKMQDKYGDIMMPIETEREAIEFLNKIGIDVEEI